MKSESIYLKVNDKGQLIITPEEGHQSEVVSHVLVDNSFFNSHSITFECKNGKTITVEYFPYNSL